MTTVTGVQAQGEGCHYDTMTRMTAMVAAMQDRLQERFPDMRPTTSLDYVIRQTNRLQELRLKLFRFFSQKPIEIAENRLRRFRMEGGVKKHLRVYPH